MVFILRVFRSNPDINVINLEIITNNIAVTNVQ